jgi:hypothetical protein
MIFATVIGLIIATLRQKNRSGKTHFIRVHPAEYLRFLIAGLSGISQTVPKP